MDTVDSEYDRLFPDVVAISRVLTTMKNTLERPNNMAALRRALKKVENQREKLETTETTQYDAVHRLSRTVVVRVSDTDHRYWADFFGFSLDPVAGSGRDIVRTSDFAVFTSKPSWFRGNGDLPPSNIEYDSESDGDEEEKVGWSVEDVEAYVGTMD